MSEIVERFIVEISVPPPRPVADWPVHADLIATCLRSLEGSAGTNLRARALLDTLVAAIESDQPLKFRVRSVCEKLLTAIETKH